MAKRSELAAQDNASRVIKCRKKPITVEAVQWTEDNFELIRKFTNGAAREYWRKQSPTPEHPDGLVKVIHLSTPEGRAQAAPGDYILKDIDENFYPVKKDIFERTYDEA